MRGVDTNLLVRYLVQDDEEQSRLAREFFERECSADDPAWINRVVLCELCWVLERSYGCTREQVAEAMTAILQTSEFRVEDLSAVWQAIRLYRSGGDFADALLVRTNAERGCTETVTFDRKAAAMGLMRLLGRKAERK